jgi:multicomponent Na+:H+ antiporter subunit D
VAFGLGGALLFVLHNMLVKTALLLGGGAVELEMGTGKLDELGGQVQRRPVLATIFFIAAFSLAGFPPSSGFIGKLALLQLTVETQQWLITGVSVFVSLLTTMSMIRLWQYMFWGKPGPRLQPLTRFNNRRSHFWTTLPPALLVAASLLLGIFAQPALETVNVAARQAADRQGYIDAVAPQQLVQQPQP